MSHAMVTHAADQQQEKYVRMEMCLDSEHFETPFRKWREVPPPSNPTYLNTLIIMMKNQLAPNFSQAPPPALLGE